MKNALKIIISLVLIILLLFSAGKLYDYYSHSYQNQKNIEELVTQEDNKAENYRKLKEENPDIIGWIRIKGTHIDYPVMWTPDQPEKYLRTDFNGNYSLNGLPFAAEDCKISSTQAEPECTNTLIYGHHMQDGTMFADLVKYENQEFYEKHKTITYDRIYEDGSYKTYNYEIIGAFKTEINTGNDHEFKYYNHTNISSESEFNEYISRLKERNLLTSSTNTEYPNNLLTRSTCSYHVAGKNGRFVVIAVEK